MILAFWVLARADIYSTDRSSQNCSHDYQKILRQHGLKASISGTGNFKDNVAVETFFKTIEAELTWRDICYTHRKAEMAIFEGIKGFDNPRR